MQELLYTWYLVLLFLFRRKRGEVNQQGEASENLDRLKRLHGLF